MKKHSMPEMKEGSVNVTPLIDVVMCLIVFFMLVAKIGVNTGALKMDLPQTIVGRKAEELGDSIILNVTDPNLDREADGATPKTDPATGALVKLNTHISEPRVTARFNDAEKDGSEVQIVRKAPGGGQPTYPLREELTKAVKARKDRGKEKDFSITIRAEKDLEYSMLQQVLAECATAGVRNLNYGAVGKKVAAPAPKA